MVRGATLFLLDKDDGRGQILGKLRVDMGLSSAPSRMLNFLKVETTWDLHLWIFESCHIVGQDGQFRMVKPCEALSLSRRSQGEAAVACW